MHKQNDFGTGSVKRLILSQALPLTVAQTVQLLYNIVDRIYIGRMPVTGQLALTGLGLTFPVILSISAFSAARFSCRSVIRSPFDCMLAADQGKPLAAVG